MEVVEEEVCEECEVKDEVWGREVEGERESRG